MTKLRWLVLLLVMALAGCGAALGGVPKPAAVPVIQRGEVAVTLDENGVALVQFPFPVEFSGAPSITVTPRGEAGFVVESFFVDAFDGHNFAVGAKGQAGLTIKFYWIAVGP